MDYQQKAFDKSPQEWIEEQDIEKLSFEKATWIPLAVSKTELEHGKSGCAGHRRAYRNVESLIIPLNLRKKYEQLEWQSVMHQGTVGAWADKKAFHPAGTYDEKGRVLYPVIQRVFETGELPHWDLLQELELGLQLLRTGDNWIRPDENDAEVAKLERDLTGRPSVLLFRAEHLRDYLCAKKAALLVTAFSIRDAVEEEFPDTGWEKECVTRQFEGGKWEGTCSPIHEGGMPYGMKTSVIRAWRESVNPQDDVPEMPDPGSDPGMKSESFTQSAKGRKLHRLSGRIWIKRWLLPGKLSPCIRRDRIESRVHFRVESQENKTLSGVALSDYRGWLWFQPTVIRHFTKTSKGRLRWCTAMTGEVGPASNQMLHFGINNVGLVNVLGYKMAELPEWAQKLWVGFNTSPEGGLSEELHMSQNLGQPAATSAPEEILFNNLQVLHFRTGKKYGQPLVKELHVADEFFKRIHRFYCTSFEEVCDLCKELHRVVVEPVDIGLLNAKIDPANAGKSNQEKLGSIKRLALWLDTLSLNGREITKPLAAVYDLRIADAHAKKDDVRSSLKLLGIPSNADNYLAICTIAIGLVANCIAQVADAVEPQK
jgi:hypothetical protein